MGKKYTEKNGRIYARENNKYAGSVPKPISPSTPASDACKETLQKLGVTSNSEEVKQTYHDMYETVRTRANSEDTPVKSQEILRRRARMKAATQRVAYLDALAITYLGDQPRWISALRTRFGYETGSDTSDWEETIQLMGGDQTDFTEEEVDSISQDEREKAAEKLSLDVQKLLDQLKESDGEHYVPRPIWLRHAEALIRITRGSTAKEELKRLQDFPEDIKLS